MELQIPNYEKEIAGKHNGFIENVGQLGVYGSGTAQATTVSYYSKQNHYTHHVQRDRLSFIHGQRIYADSSLHEVNKLDVLFYENGKETPQLLVPSPHLERHAKYNFYTNLTGTGAENVREFGELYFRNLYEGIDMSLSNNRVGVRAHFQVKPGYDPLTIRIGFNGLTSLNFSNSNINIGNYSSNYTLLDPIAYQIDNLDNITFIPVSYSVDMTGKVFFAVGAYDVGQKLFISLKQGNNPIPSKDAGDNMEWSSYIGELGVNALADVTADENGNSIYFGSVEDEDFLSGNNTFYQLTPHHGSLDAFLIKFNTIMEPQFYTYFGGSSVNSNPDYSGKDIAKSITTGPNSIYVTGGTTSTNIVHMNSTGFSGDPNNNPNCNYCFDLFYAQFNSNGNLQYSTYYGGDEHEMGESILRKNNSTYIIGEGSGTSTPYLAPVDPTKYISNDGNGLILRFDASNNLIWSTGFKVDKMLASSTNEAIHLITGGSVAGQTLPNVNQSSDPNFNTFNGGATDGFIAIFDAQDALISTSYYGTDCEDYITDIAGFGGNTSFYGVGAIVDGTNCGSDLPVIGNGFSRPSGNESEHFYFHAYPTNVGIDFLHSGYFGGGGEERYQTEVIFGIYKPAISLISNGFAITGPTQVDDLGVQKIPLLSCNPIDWYSEDECFISTSGNYPGTADGRDAYVAIFDFDCDLLYSTYFGRGMMEDGGTSMAYTNSNGLNRLYFGGNAGTVNEQHFITDPNDFLYCEEYDPTIGTTDYFEKVGNPGTNANMWGAFFTLDGINDYPCNLGLDDSFPKGDLKVNVFPNPTNNSLKVVSDENIVSLAVLDLSGRVCLSLNGYGKYFDLNLEQFSQGEYILQGKTESYSFNIKIIKI